MIKILAPHVDDEVIGCWSILQQFREDLQVIYTEPLSIPRTKEAKKVAEYFGYAWKIIPWYSKLMEELREGTYEDSILVPDPHWEFHPEHKRLGYAIWELCCERKIGFSTYSTNMNVPYLRTLADAEKKHEILDKFFPSQKTLWQFDFKYFLFEGISQWIIPD